MASMPEDHGQSAPSTHSFVTVRHTGNLWEVSFPNGLPAADFENLKAAVKALGADWDSKSRVWVLAEVRRVDALIYANATAKDTADFLSRCQQARLQFAGAVPMNPDAPLSPPGLTLMPHQVEGVQWVAERPGSLLAFCMGSGKTATSAACLNAAPSFKRALVICPASLKRNWYNELKRWMVDTSRTVGIAQGSYLPPTDVVIINYDILDRHKPALDAVVWDFIFVDEAHFCKSPKAKRTKCLIGGKTGGKSGVPYRPLHAHRKVALTGTPIVNQPSDIWPICNWLDPKSWPNLYWFEGRYCKFETKYFGRGKARVYAGAQHLDELNARLKGTIMLRKTKAQVLPDLPPKFRQVIEVDVLDSDSQSVDGQTVGQLLKEEARLLATMKQRLATLQAAIQLARVSGDEASYREAINALSDYYKGPEGEHVAVVRQKIALAKLPYVIDDIRNSLLDPSIKVLVGAHHRRILESIRDQLTAAGIGCVLLYGDLSDDERQSTVDRFQNDPTVRVFIGGFRAAGVGLNLTAASQVVFAEEDYVPSTITQFEDRAHRIGTKNPILVKHIVAHGSLDSRIAKLAIAKQEVADRSIDGGVEAQAPVDWLGDHRSAPTDEELMAPISGNEVSASTYGLRRLVTNPREYGVSDQDLIIAERLSNRELTGRPAALARWLMKKYLEPKSPAGGPLAT